MSYKSLETSSHKIYLERFKFYLQHIKTHKHVSLLLMMVLNFIKFIQVVQPDWANSLCDILQDLLSDR